MRTIWLMERIAQSNRKVNAFNWLSNSRISAKRRSTLFFVMSLLELDTPVLLPPYLLHQGRQQITCRCDTIGMGTEAGDRGLVEDLPQLTTPNHTLFVFEGHRAARRSHPALSSYLPSYRPSPSRNWESPLRFHLLHSLCLYHRVSLV